MIIIALVMSLLISTQLIAQDIPDDSMASLSSFDQMFTQDFPDDDSDQVVPEAAAPVAPAPAPASAPVAPAAAAPSAVTVPPVVAAPSPVVAPVAAEPSAAGVPTMQPAPSTETKPTTSPTPTAVSSDAAVMSPAPAPAPSSGTFSPAPAPEATPVAPSPDDLEFKLDDETSIDTLGQEEPQGNWLFKRIWWEQSESRYEKLRGLASMVQELRMEFLTKRTKVERDLLDPFYLSIGVGQGELQAIIAGLLENKSDKTQAKPSLPGSKESQDLLVEAQQEHEQLEQLGRDVEAIVTLEGRLDEAIDTLMQLVGRVAKSEQEAWQFFKDVSRVLNDKKAQELSYRIKGAADNISADLDYIKGPYAKSFDELMQQIPTQVDRVKNGLKVLKEKGIILKGKMQQAYEEEQLKRCEYECQQKIDAIPPVEEPIKSSWTSYIFSPFVWIGHTIVSIIRSPYDLIAYLFFKGESSEPEYEEESLPEVTEKSAK